MPLTLDQLNVIDMINRKGSFSAAAQQLNRVPSALSYTLNKLEQDLGIEVFNRSGHRAVLTPAGEILLEEGRLLLSASDKLEKKVKFIHDGWESKLNIVMGELVKFENIIPVINDFYSLEIATQIIVSQEVLSGTWDSLVSGRANVAVGAAFEGPNTGSYVGPNSSGYIATQMGAIKFLFVVSPNHPLAEVPEPLTEDIISKYLGVVAMDSSKNLPARFAGVILPNQHHLKVQSLQHKLEAYRAGIGVGTLPRFMVEEDIRQGRLVTKKLVSDLPKPPFYVAMNNTNAGKAAKWFYRRLCNIYLYEDLYL